MPPASIQRGFFILEKRQCRWHTAVSYLKQYMKERGIAVFLDPMRWFTADTPVSRELARFTAGLPDICDPKEIAEFFLERLGPIRGELPFIFKPLFLAEHVSHRALSGMLHTGMRVFAKIFVAANGPNQTLRTVWRLKRAGYRANIDILGEAVRSEKEAEAYADAYGELAELLSRQFSGEDLSISLKPSAFYSQMNPAAPEEAAWKIFLRIYPIAKILHEQGGHFYLDAEEHEFSEIHFIVFRKLYAAFGNTARFVLQAYLRDSWSRLLDLCDLNDTRSPVHVRLVRGAYWDHECYRAERLSLPEPPVYTRKPETDEIYHFLLREGLAHGLCMVPGTHNAQSIIWASRLAPAHGKRLPEFQMLYGMGEALARAVQKKGHGVRFYLPVLFPQGNISQAMAYLVRRIVENKSQMSFLVQHSGPQMKEVIKTLGTHLVPARKEVANA